MIIRQDHIDSLETVKLPEFENHMLQRLDEFTPMHSKTLGEEGMRAIIRLGVERAKAHGFTRKGPVQFYIEMIFLLGVDFDTDPQFPWVAQILQDRTVADQTDRADRVYERVMAYLREVGGPDREYARRALLRARELGSAGPLAGRTASEQQLLQQMRETYPEKFDYVGEEPLRALIQRAKKEAQAYSVETSAAVSLFAGLMYALGHGVLRDPKYPFIDSTLRNAAIGDLDKRASRVYSKIMTYLDHVLTNTERS